MNIFVFFSVQHNNKRSLLHMTTETHYRKDPMPESSHLELAEDGHRSDGATPVVKGPKGLCYDLGKIADEGRRKRIIANRESAKISRQRKLDDARAMHYDMARLQEENSSLREANAALERRIAETLAGFEGFKPFVPTANSRMHSAGTIETHSPSASAGLPIGGNGAQGPPDALSQHAPEEQRLRSHTARHSSFAGLPV
jgi:hypothetical protein